MLAEYKIELFIVVIVSSFLYPRRCFHCKAPLNTMIESAELYLTSFVVETAVEVEVVHVGCSGVLMVDGVVAAVVVVT